MAEEKNKPWRFLEIDRDNLEDELNKLADEGYHVFKMERTYRSGCVYEIIALNPTLIAEKQGTLMASQFLQKLGIDPSVLAAVQAAATTKPTG